MKLRSAVLSTLAYAAVFRQALPVEQIHFFLVQQKASLAQIKKIVAHFVRQKKLGAHNHHYFLPLFPPHRHNQTVLDQKYQLALRATRLLSWIATIQLIGVSGAVAAGSPQKGDDIDLFIITSPGCVWITRLCAVIMLELCGIRRKPRDRYVADKICLNFFLDSNHLQLPPDDHTLYGAHEVVQMQPLWDEGVVYRNFLNVNSWVSHFLPNAYSFLQQHAQQRSVSNFMRHSAVFLISLFEQPARIIQWWYMKKRKMHEVITAGVARFHPNKTSSRILKRFITIQQQIA